MFNKLYENIREFLLNNYKNFIILIIGIFLVTFKLPFYIESPGGLLDVSRRIEIENANVTEGSINMAYMSEMRATIPFYLFSLINRNWNVVTKENVVPPNETPNDVMVRGRILLQESMNNAVFLGATRAGREVSEIDFRPVVIMIFPEAETNLRIGDHIVRINGLPISRIEDISFEAFEEGEKLDIEVANNDQIFMRYAVLKELENRLRIGVWLQETRTIETDFDYRLRFRPSESGPSGGLMTALSIYNMLSDVDLTKGRRIAGTGTINLDGTVGDIGGVRHKIIGAARRKTDIFIIPNGKNYEEAIKIKNERNLDIKIVGVSTFDEALEYLLKN